MMYIHLLYVPLLLKAVSEKSIKRVNYAICSTPMHIHIFTSVVTAFNNSYFFCYVSVITFIYLFITFYFIYNLDISQMIRPQQFFIFDCILILKRKMETLKWSFSPASLRFLLNFQILISTYDKVCEDLFIYRTESLLHFVIIRHF